MTQKREIAPGYQALEWETIFALVESVAAFSDSLEREGRLDLAIKYSRIHLEVALQACGYDDDEIRRNMPDTVKQAAAAYGISEALTLMVTRALRSRNQGQHRGRSRTIDHVRNDVRRIHEFCAKLGTTRVISDVAAPTQTSSVRNVKETPPASQFEDNFALGLNIGLVFMRFMAAAATANEARNAANQRSPEVGAAAQRPQRRADAPPASGSARPFLDRLAEFSLFGFLVRVAVIGTFVFAIIANLSDCIR